EAGLRAWRAVGPDARGGRRGVGGVGDPDAQEPIRAVSRLLGTVEGRPVRARHQGTQGLAEHLLRLGPDRLRDTGLRAEERAGPEVAVPRAPAPPAARRAAARQDGRPDVDGRRPRDAAGPRPRDRRAPRVVPTAADVAEPRAVPPRGR